MKKQKLLLILLLACFMSSNVKPNSKSLDSNTQISLSDSIHITLADAIELALQDNPTIIIAGKEVDVKRQQQSESLWNLLPAAALNVSYSNMLEKQIMTMDMPDGPQMFKVGSSHNYNASFNLGVPVFAPALYIAMNMSKKDVALAVEKSRASKIDLLNEVVKAYFQILLSQDSYKVLYKSLKQAEENLHIVTSKFTYGKVSEYDKIRADVQMRNIVPSVIAASNAIKLAKMQLKVLMGLNTNIELAIKDNLNDYRRLLIKDHFEDINNPSQINLSRNSLLKQIDLTQDLLNQRVKLQKSNYLPVISLNYTYSYISQEEKIYPVHDGWFPSSTVGITIAMPIFKGSNITKARVAKIELAKAYYTRVDTERNLRMQATSYLDNMSAGYEQIASNEVSVELAEKGRDIAKTMYEVGKGTILELNDSEVALVQAELAYNQAIYNYLVARSEYAKVLGSENYFQKMNVGNFNQIDE